MTELDKVKIIFNNYIFFIFIVSELQNFDSADCLDDIYQR